MRVSALLVGGPVGRLLATERAVALPALDSPDWAALEKEAARQTVRMSRAAALLVVGGVCVSWPIDLAVFERAPVEQAFFTSWRVTVVVVFLAMYATLTWSRAAQRHPALASAPFCVAACAALGYFLSGLGGLERPFFNMICAVMIVPILAPAYLLTRVGFTTALAGAVIAGFFGPHPEYADTSSFPESLFFLGTMFGASILLGHFAYVGFCLRFFQGLELERSALALATLNAELGERVRAQTADLRRLAEHVQIVQEDERGRIARELHDELGQRLSAVRYVVARARQGLTRAPATIGPNLAELDTMVEGALACTRDIVSGLRPALLDQMGLAPAIEWLATRVSAQAGLACTLDLAAEVFSDTSASLVAYRVVQESLTNVTRHAGARSVQITMRVSQARLEIDVTDDGCGFPPEGTTAPSKCNGILGMRERAAALGGELDTDNVPAGGARVRLRLPLAPVDPARPELAGPAPDLPRFA